MKKKLIEVALPLEAINKASALEKPPARDTTIDDTLGIAPVMANYEGDFLEPGDRHHTLRLREKIPKCTLLRSGPDLM